MQATTATPFPIDKVRLRGEFAPISTNLILSYIGEHVLGTSRSFLRMRQRGGRGPINGEFLDQIAGLPKPFQQFGAAAALDNPVAHLNQAVRVSAFQQGR